MKETPAPARRVTKAQACALLEALYWKTCAGPDVWEEALDPYTVRRTRPEALRQIRRAAEQLLGLPFSPEVLTRAEEDLKALGFFDTCGSLTRRGAVWARRCLLALLMGWGLPLLEGQTGPAVSYQRKTGRKSGEGEDGQEGAKQ